jgi:hypothetical protein
VVPNVMQGISSQTWLNRRCTSTLETRSKRRLQIQRSLVRLLLPAIPLAIK